MRFIDQITLKVRRGEGPFYGNVRKIFKGVMGSNLPVPSFVRPLYRALYGLHFGIRAGIRWVFNYFYTEPLFRSRCTSAGRNLFVWQLPHVTGHVKIHLGNRVSIFGHLGVGAGRIFDDPVLRIGDDVDIGHNVFLTVNKEIIIEEEVNIANNVRILDTDAHPRDTEARARKLPPTPEEVRPVRICRRAWLGQGCSIMKGVTVGEGAVIGVDSVVINDIPPYAVAVGNPARVVVKDLRARPAPSAAPQSAG